MINERRTHRRSTVVATIVLAADNFRTTHYVVRNLSAGGALIAGQPVPSVGTHFVAVLNLRAGKAVRLAVKVVRQDPVSDGIPTFAIAFFQVPPRVQDLIQDAVLAELELTGPDIEPTAKRGVG